MRRPNEVNGVDIPTVEDAFGADIASIHEVLRGQPLVCRQIGLDGVKRGVILLRRRRGRDLRDEVRKIVFAALGQMDFVPDPLLRALAPVAHVPIIRGT